MNAERARPGRTCASRTAPIGAGLRSSGVRLTSVRERILQAICTFEGHFRAEDVARVLREAGTPISLVTVYRNLPMLERTGVVRRTCLARGATSWERTWESAHHDHLICTACGRVVEFVYRPIDVLQEEAAAEHGFLLTGHHLELLGLCPACRKKAGGRG